MHSNEMQIAENLRVLRARKNMSLRDVARVLDITPQSLSNYENGTSVPSYPLAWKIADFYNVTLDELGGRNRTVRSRQIA